MQNNYPMKHQLKVMLERRLKAVDEATLDDIAERFQELFEKKLNDKLNTISYSIKETHSRDFRNMEYNVLHRTTYVEIARRFTAIQRHINSLRPRRK